MKNPSRWIRWWLIGAAVLGVGLIVANWAAREVHHWRIEQRMAQHRELIERHAAEADLEVALVTSVVRTESGGDPRARSHVDARGLMQIMPVTHTDVRRRFDLPDGDLYDPAYNLRVGTTYLRYLLDRFDHDPHLALAAYHMGPTRVARILRDHPDLTGPHLVRDHANPTTRAYVEKVLTLYRSAEGSP